MEYIQKCTKKYPNTSQCIQDIYEGVPRYTKYQAAAGRPRHRLGGAAPPPLGILYTLVYLYISWIHLDICLVYFNIFWYTPKLNFAENDGSSFQLIGHTQILSTHGCMGLHGPGKYTRWEVC